jgi:hypothetical protein
MNYWHLFILALSLNLSAAEPAGDPIFADDFARDEATPDKEDVGKQWRTNSAWRAKGMKQADLREGALFGTTVKEADHALVLFQKAPLRNGVVELRFKLGKEDSFTLEFADPACKEVHAGHLCLVKVTPAQLVLTDTKTGNMNLKVREQLLAKKTTPELKDLLKQKSKTFPLTLAADAWHTLRFSAQGDTLSATMDGIEVGALSSEGVAHPTKDEIRITIAKSAWIDDVKIWKLP